MKNVFLNFGKSLFILSITLLFLVGCTSNSSTSPDASEVLEGQVFSKHSGDGPEQLAFTNDGLFVQEAGNITPVMDEDDIEDAEESESTQYDNVDLVNGDEGEFIVEHEGEELYRFHMNEDDLLEEEGGTIYLSDTPSGESTES